MGEGTIRLGLVGIGKIARDQHVPAIAGSKDFVLAATADPHGGIEGVPGHATLGEMIAAGGIDAVAICTPPAIRHRLAREAIAAGLHVLLEKPPAATMIEAEDLVARAGERDVTLFAAWHSRHAAMVAGARAWLANARIEAVEIVWKEDIRRWHPGQEWILGESGFGVFDPAINALSILTGIVPGAITVERAELTIPRGRAAPLAAMLGMRLAGGAPVGADLDFLQTGPQTWTITVATDRGTLVLADGGARMIADGHERTGDNREYPGLYARFHELIMGGASDMDLRPLALVADAYRIAERRIGEPFAF
jgi:D-galactose 1-dehydrogenase/L-arabinose 1- dehydrogenase